MCFSVLFQREKKILDRINERNQTRDSRQTNETKKERRCPSRASRHRNAKPASVEPGDARLPSDRWCQMRRDKHVEDDCVVNGDGGRGCPVGDGGGFGKRQVCNRPATRNIALISRETSSAMKIVGNRDATARAGDSYDAESSRASTPSRCSAAARRQQQQQQQQQQHQQQQRWRRRRNKRRVIIRNECRI